MSNRPQVKQWMGRDVEDGMDTARGLSSRLLRVREHAVMKVGIGGEASVNDHINALLDLLAWHHYEVAHGKKPGNCVQLIIGRGPHTEAALPPLRTLRKIHTGSPSIELRVESESTEGLLETDDAGPPTFESGAPTQYAQYLMDWHAKAPTGLALEVLQSSDSERIRLYPQLSQSTDSGRWSLRVDGLQVGEVGATEGILKVGGGQESSSQKAAMVWRNVSDGQNEIPFTEDSLDRAIDLIHELTERLEQGQHPEQLLDHGVPEHALESAVVRGTIGVTIGGRPLLPLRHDQSIVAYGSQIPTLWTPHERPRYLDALLRDGQVPWAMEMKVKAGGGYGAYLRHAIGQAVLYRYFLQMAPAYRSWFDAQGLDQLAVRAAVVYPQPTEEVQRKIAVRIDNLLLTAAAFDVQVATVDAGWLQ